VSAPGVAGGDSTIHIVGAGPAGLAAAITAAQAGTPVVVHERESRVGSRFHDDFQGLENWSTRGDVLGELELAGLRPDCELTPFHEQTCFGPDGQERVIRSRRPLYYLLRRGSHPGTLDASLLSKALALGVEVRFGDRLDHLPEGGIVAGGPRAVDAIAVGYLFTTMRLDGAFVAFDNALAPGGYAYLLIHDGRGTLATCFFKDFHREKEYLARAVAFFHNRIDLNMEDARPFSGYGSFGLPATAVRGMHLLAGEAIGFQDPLWGFGLRYALLSGHLAARAVLAGTPAGYDALWKRRFTGFIRAALVNRMVLDRLGNRGYRWLLAGAAASADVRTWLRRRYSPSLAKRCLFPLARRAVHSRRRQQECIEPGCDCTWCRCQHRASAEEA